MPTSNPRINLTLTQEQYDLVSRLARINGKSRAAVLMEFFETVIPVLERVCVVAEAAERMQAQTKEGLLASLERAEATIAPLAAEAMGQLDLLIPTSVGAQAVPSAPAPLGRSRAAERSANAPRSRKRKAPVRVIRGPGRGAGTPRKSPSRGRRS